MELVDTSSLELDTAAVRPVGVSCSSVLAVAPLDEVPMPATPVVVVVARSGVCDGDRLLVAVELLVSGLLTPDDAIPVLLVDDPVAEPLVVPVEALP